MSDDVYPILHVLIFKLLGNVSTEGFEKNDMHTGDKVLS